MAVTNNTNTQTESLAPNTLRSLPTSSPCPPPGPCWQRTAWWWWSDGEVASCCLVSPAELTRSLSRLNIRQKLKSEDKSLSILLMRWNVSQCQNVTKQVASYHHLIGAHFNPGKTETDENLEMTDFSCEDLLNILKPGEFPLLTELTRWVLRRW